MMLKASAGGCRAWRRVGLGPAQFFSKRWAKAHLYAARLSALIGVARFTLRLRSIQPVGESMHTNKNALALMLALAVLATGAAAQEPTPQYGKWGFDLAGADKTAQPGDDFFRYANGTWLDKTAIPADKPGYSLRLAMTDLT